MSNGRIPRIVISGTGSGVGKTTVVLGIVQALQKRGLKVATFKCGPDYLDPTYHKRVTGRTCHNLDGWMMGHESVISTFLEGAKDADIAVIEGVMGLFDGHSPVTDAGSTAEIAKWLQAPVVAIIDASGMSRTIAPVFHGLKNFDNELRVEAAIANFIGSEYHLELIRKALFPVTVIGGLPKSYEQALPARHLGLTSASEEAVKTEALEFWGTLTEKWFDIAKIIEIASTAGELTEPHAAATDAVPVRCRIAVARDRAFHFYYEDNLKILKRAGAELVYFSPLEDKGLPDAEGLYIGGGYPELFAGELSANRSLLDDIRKFAKSGFPVYAECGGLMYLSEGIETVDGSFFSMLGLIPGKTKMEKKLVALGYVEVNIEKDSILGEAGMRFRGHQFRYSDYIFEDDNKPDLAYRVRKRRGDIVSMEGYSRGNILASYVHAHWASNPKVAERFVDSCAGAVAWEK